MNKIFKKYMYRCFWNNGLYSIWMGPVSPRVLHVVINDYRKWMYKIQVKEVTQ